MFVTSISLQFLKHVKPFLNINNKTHWFYKTNLTTKINCLEQNKDMKIVQTKIRLGAYNVYKFHNKENLKKK